MSFWDIVTSVGKAAENEMYKKIDENKKMIKKYLRQKSDKEIEYAYRRRYENSKLASWQREALEEEAERRGIS